MSYNTIKVKKYSDVIEEKVAAGEIYPGMLLELDSSGEVQAHSDAGKNAVPIMIALEDELQGNGIDDAYSADDPVQVWIPGRGDEAYMILADGENVAIGAELESDGNGYLQAVVAESATGATYPNSVIGIAMEAVDLSGSSGEESSGALGYNKRVLVKIV